MRKEKTSSPWQVRAFCNSANTQTRNYCETVSRTILKAVQILKRQIALLHLVVVIIVSQLLGRSVSACSHPYSWCVFTRKSCQKEDTKLQCHFYDRVCGRRGGLMFIALDSGRSGFDPSSGHCVVFLGKTLFSHSASLHPGV